MFQTRHLRRRTVRSTVRRASRAAFRVRWRAPDDLGAALTAYGRAFRARRRLARLAPRFFDPVVIERERRHREDRRRWMALWEPALAQAYGCALPPHKAHDDLPPLPSPRTQQAVERQLACWNLWFNLAHEAIRRHQQRRPHALIDFGRLARLLEIGMDFGRLASGVAPDISDSVPANDDAAWADLKRAYGHLYSSTPSDPGSSPTPVSPESNPAPSSEPVQSVYAMPVVSSGPIHPATDNLRPPPTDSTACPAAPIPLEYHRRDAWSRWARHVRSLKR
jgi:hypothetical protein